MFPKEYRKDHRASLLPVAWAGPISFVLVEMAENENEISLAATEFLYHPKVTLTATPLSRGLHQRFFFMPFHGSRSYFICLRGFFWPLKLCGILLESFYCFYCPRLQWALCAITRMDDVCASMNIRTCVFRREKKKRSIVRGGRNTSLLGLRSNGCTTSWLDMINILMTL